MKQVNSILSFLTIVFFYSCCTFEGSSDLGNNLFLLEGDRLEDQIIVYCTAKESGCCTSGSYVIPIDYESHMKDGQYYEYVQKTKSNNKWVLASTKVIGLQKENFWIIDKGFKVDQKDSRSNNSYDQIIKSHLWGPLTFLEFRSKKDELGIKLDF